MQTPQALCGCNSSPGCSATWAICVEVVLWVVQVMKIGQVIRDEFEGKKDLSGIGGVESGRDAAEFLLLGANTVQVHVCIGLLCCHSNAA